ncbi:MAG: imidazolonepropionase [Bacteroidia bacterium]|nr:imidazolonepropionase [Bacteroidia bacterium]
MQKLLIKNIHTLHQVRENITTPIRGEAMKEVPVLHNAWLAIEDGIIVDYGNMEEFPGISDWKNLEVIDAENKNVFPCFVDAHTHLVFAGNREQEFVWRLQGMSYQEIAQRGGGILNSAQKLRETAEVELFELAQQRIRLLIKMGTGAIEIKSGYGLNTEAELKMLRIIKKLKEHFHIPIKSTFLGAHAIPSEYKNNKEKYIEIICNDMLPKIADEQLADFIDVFCEDGYFTAEETEYIIEKGIHYGLKGKIHAEQLSHSGGIEIGVKTKCISVDHLEYATDKDIQLLKNSTTIPVILPGAAYFLNLPPAPARQMIDNDLPLAIASDFNPGSSPSANMPMMMSLACVMNRLTPYEAYNAATINAAFAMDTPNVGWIGIGNFANFFITDKSVTPVTFAYHFAHPLIEQVFIMGKSIS